MNNEISADLTLLSSDFCMCVAAFQVCATLSVALQYSYDVKYFQKICTKL